MKKILLSAMILMAAGCVRMRYFHITLSDDCVAQKIEVFKKEKLEEVDVRKKTFIVKYNKHLFSKITYALEDTHKLPNFDIGTIRFDENMHISFTQAQTDTYEGNVESQQEKMAEFLPLIEEINTKKQITIPRNEYFEMQCFSSENVPIWAQSQDYDVVVKIDDPLFFSAFSYYLQTNKYFFMLLSD